MCYIIIYYSNSISPPIWSWECFAEPSHVDDSNFVFIAINPCRLGFRVDFCVKKTPLTRWLPEVGMQFVWDIIFRARLGFWIRCFHVCLILTSSVQKWSAWDMVFNGREINYRMAQNPRNFQPLHWYLRPDLWIPILRFQQKFASWPFPLTARTKVMTGQLATFSIANQGNTSKKKG